MVMSPEGIKAFRSGLNDTEHAPLQSRAIARAGINQRMRGSCLTMSYKQTETRSCVFGSLYSQQRESCASDPALLRKTADLRQSGAETVRVRAHQPRGHSRLRLLISPRP